MAKKVDVLMAYYFNLRESEVQLGNVTTSFVNKSAQSSVESVKDW